MKLVTKIKNENTHSVNWKNLLDQSLSGAEGVNMTESAPLIQSWHESEVGQKRGRFWRFLARKLASNAYVRRAIEKEVTLDALKTSPSPKFLFGLGLVLLSYVLGWPMVGLLSVLSAYFQAPVLLMLGPAFMGSLICMDVRDVFGWARLH